MNIVTTATELLEALSRASSGDIIELPPGNYGDLTLDDIRFMGMVTLRSQDPLAPATFQSLQVKNSSFIALDNVVVRHPLQVNEPDWVAGFRIDKSDHISVLNSEICGSGDGNHTNDGQGLLVLDSNHIQIRDTRFYDLKTGLSVGRSEFVTATGNTFEDIRSDGAVFANVRHVVVEGNTFSSFHPAIELGDHPDMVQVWNDGSFGDMYDLAIRNNTLTRGAGGDVQSILVQGAIAGPSGTMPPNAHDLVIEGNLIEGGAAQGIWVSNFDQVRIANNSLTQAADGGTAPTIRTDHTNDTRVESNFAPRIDDVGSTGFTSSGNTITGGIDGIVVRRYRRR